MKGWKTRNSMGRPLNYENDYYKLVPTVNGWIVIDKEKKLRFNSVYLTPLDAKRATEEKRP